MGGAASLVRVVTEIVCQGTEVGAECLMFGMNGTIAMRFYGGEKSKVVLSRAMPIKEASIADRLEP